MKLSITRLLALLLLLVVVGSSCGTTIYRKKVYKSNKWAKHRKRQFFWHEHHYRPRSHNGGYW